LVITETFEEGRLKVQHSERELIQSTDYECGAVGKEISTKKPTLEDAPEFPTNGTLSYQIFTMLELFMRPTH